MNIAGKYAVTQTKKDKCVPFSVIYRYCPEVFIFIYQILSIDIIQETRKGSLMGWGRFQGEREILGAEAQMVKYMER